MSFNLYCYISKIFAAKYNDAVDVVGMRSLKLLYLTDRFLPFYIHIYWSVLYNFEMFIRPEISILFYYSFSE